MNKIRLTGLITIIIGIIGTILSISADRIGLSLFGGAGGWGVMNSAGVISGCFLLLFGLIMALKPQESTQETREREIVTIIGIDGPLRASTIPIIVPPEKRSFYLEPRRTVIKKEEAYNTESQYDQGFH